MDKSTGVNPVNDVEIRGRSSCIEKNLSRDTSMSSTCSSVIYHKRVTMNNGMDIDSDMPVEAPALSYKTEQEKQSHLSKVTGTSNNTRPQGVNNGASSMQSDRVDHVSPNETCGEAPCDNNDNVINIQIAYDPNMPTEPKLWSGNFQSISLYGSIEHIASDTKSIKDSLNFMVKYISNKKVNPKTTNNLKDLDGIGNSVWNFISSVYQAGWDSLYMDNKSRTLREKISSKFTPRITPSSAQKSNKNIPKLTPVSIERVPPPPLLPAKTAKEVNVILKYFQNKKPSNDTNKVAPKNDKLYAQVSKAPANTSEVLKISKAFPALNAEKIDQINNIVKGVTKPKPKIQMTTKGLLRKQVIILMSKENIDFFMKNSSLHVANINR